MANNPVEDILTHVDGRLSRGEHVVVGLDLFDTVFTRIIPKELSLEVMCRAIARNLLGDVNKHFDVQQAYEEAYNESAAINSGAGLDYEATTEALFAGWTSNLTKIKDDILESDVVDCIIAVESSLLVSIPNTFELLTQLKKRNVRVVYVSDMYLGKPIIDELLNRLSIGDLFSDGYVSSDYSLLKRTGRLFTRVLEDEGLSPEQMIFAGDDPLADVEWPQTHGMASVHFVFPELEEERVSLRLAFERGIESKDELANAVVQAAGGCCFANTSVEAFSANKYLGPYFASFGFAVQQEYSNLKYNNILFAAREGLLLLRVTEVFDRYFHAGNEHRKIYLPASRLTALAFSLADEGLSMLDVANLAKNGKRTLRTILSFLSLEEKRLNEVLKLARIPDPDIPLVHNLLEWDPIYRLVKVINELPEFKSFVAMGNRFQKWMTQNGIQAGQFNLFVDLGWSAQIQDSIARGFERRNIPMNFVGLYSGTRLSAHWRRRPGNEICWYHSDESQHDTVSKATLWFPQILETICRSPHGTTIGFSEPPDGPVQVLFKEDRSPLEVQDDPLISRMHELILVYADRLAKLCSLFALQPWDLRGVVNERVFKFLMVPEQQVARLFSGFCNISDLGSSETFAYRGGMGQPGKDNPRFADIEHTTLWPSGAAASYFGEDAAYAYAEQYIRNLVRSGNLTRSDGMTLDNTNGRLGPKNAASTRSEDCEPTIGLADHQLMYDGLTEVIGNFSRSYELTELKQKAAFGSVAFSPADRRDLHHLVARGQQAHLPDCWPPSGNSSMIAKLHGDDHRLRNDLHAARALAEERFKSIQEMDQMIKERDEVIEAQEKLCIERYQAIQDMNQMIVERDDHVTLLLSMIRGQEERDTSEIRGVNP
ncbi:HAD hydrolase-like protein (plasmid) [Rhizobium sp. CB3060]|uniref:HAD hydrolase-like protein n=1 Tax=Rhizobium sp. CB3060 TaxID=3138255 RepID=UPI0021A823DA|nr:HAD hydrolase-like protein [Rhizobium tropici]UWU23535.1 HAD hydrolase-like protein [Rhizobium tropici]